MPGRGGDASLPLHLTNNYTNGQRRKKRRGWLCVCVGGGTYQDRRDEKYVIRVERHNNTHYMNKWCTINDRSNLTSDSDTHVHTHTYSHLPLDVKPKNVPWTRLDALISNQSLHSAAEELNQNSSGPIQGVFPRLFYVPLNLFYQLH